MLCICPTPFPPAARPPAAKPLWLTGEDNGTAHKGASDSGDDRSNEASFFHVHDPPGYPAGYYTYH